MIESEKIKKSINSIVQLDSEEWETLANFLEIRSIKKNEFFIREGQFCDSIAFVKKGALIYYKILENADEVTTDFAFENEWLTDNHSRLKGSPSHLNIRAIEDSELLILKHSDLLDL